MVDCAQVASVSRIDPEISPVGSSANWRMVGAAVSGATPWNRNAIRTWHTNRSEVRKVFVAQGTDPKIFTFAEHLSEARRGGSRFPIYGNDMANVPVHTQRVLVLLTSPDGTYALREPVTLQLSDADQDGIYVATDEFSTTYGTGETVSEAIRDYSTSLFDEFEDLEENEDALGIALQRELDSLRHHIVRM